MAYPPAVIATGRVPWIERLILGLSLAVVLSACAAPDPSQSELPSPTPTGPAIATPAASPSPEATAIPTAVPPASPTPTPGATLAPLDTSIFGEGDWEIIATETADRGATRVEVLGAVRVGFAAAITCIGSGHMRVSIWATGPAGTDPAAPRPTPVSTVSFTVQCPTTEVLGVDTGELDGRDGIYLSPDVSGPPDVRYRLILGTRRS